MISSTKVSDIQQIRCLLNNYYKLKRLSKAINFVNVIQSEQKTFHNDLQYNDD